MSAGLHKVQRIKQLVTDFTPVKIDQCKILDLGCGPGIYSIEMALMGANIYAIDARIERMQEGKKKAAKLGLKNIKFEIQDIRNMSLKKHGKFDIILFLGLMYHINAPDIFSVLKEIYQMCDKHLIIDTHISLENLKTVVYNNIKYHGKEHREHNDNETLTQRHAKLLNSIDNTFSFWFTKQSLLKLLNNIGFTSILECHVPFEPHKPKDRLTLLAKK